MVKRKTVIVLALILFIFPVFASKNSISINFSPCAIQIATSSEEDEKPVSSQYGIGAEVVYQHHFSKHFFVEGGIGWDTFLMKDENPKALTNLIFFGGIGFTQSFTEVFSINAHVDIAGDTLLYDKSASETISVKTGINCVSVVNDNISLIAGCDGVFGFARKSSINYVNYRILPMLGMKVCF